MRAIRCPYLYCTNVKKNGRNNGKQSYYCHDCKVAWTNKNRPNRKLNKLWEQYAEFTVSEIVLQKDIFRLYCIKFLHYALKA